jgi:transmembrane 9 superfamily protein 2/4
MCCCRDIARYNALEAQEEAAEETGWKLVHGDVFRPPENASLLSTYVGVGVQIFGMLLVTTFFALLGFLSPSNRGGLMTAMVLMFVCMGIVAGYRWADLCFVSCFNSYNQRQHAEAFGPAAVGRLQLAAES